MDGSVFLVTGGSRGIGPAIAVATLFAAAGAMGPLKVLACSGGITGANLAVSGGR